MSTPIVMPLEFPGMNNLQKLERRMKALEDTVEALNVDLAKNAKATKATGRAAATASGNIQRMGVAFRTTLAPIVAAYGALNFFNRALTTATDRDTDLRVLERGLQRIGGTEADLKKLNQQADEFGNNTLFNQEDFTAGAGVLTSFTDLAVDSYSRIISIAGDVAQTNKGPVKDSLLQVAKALNDPVSGLTALSRSGIQFSEDQKEVIKSLVETNEKAKAQEMILKELERQYGGSAIAAAGGLAGAQDSLGEAFRDFQQVVGQGVTPVVEKLTKQLTDVFEALSKIEPETVTAAAEFAEFAAKAGVVVLGLKGILALKAATLAFFTSTATGATAASVGLAKMNAQLAILKGNAAFLSKAALLAAPFVALGMVLNENIQQAKDFESAMAGSLDVIDPKIEELKNKQQQLLNALDVEKGRAFYRGQSGEIARLKGEIEVYGEKIDYATRMRELVVRITTQKTKIDGIGEFQSTRTGRLVPVAKPKVQETVDEITNTLSGVTNGGGGGAKGPDRVKMGDEMLEQQRRRLELLYAESDLEKALLQIENERADALKRVAEIAPEMQDQATINVNQIFDAEKGIAIGEALAQDLQDTMDLTAAREAALRPLEDQRELLEAQLKGNAEEVKLRQQARDIARDIAGLDQEQVFGILKQNRALEEQVQAAQALQAQYRELANGIAGEMTGAFRSIIDGSKSAEEAMSQMFKGIADKFLDMAMQILQDAIVQQLIKLIPALFGGGVPAAGPMPGAFSIGASFDGGGYTGDGPRAGGLDGKGGYMAMVHPQETVIDHREAMGRYTAGNGVPATQNLNISYTVTEVAGQRYVTEEEFRTGMEMTRKQATRDGAAGGHARSMQTLLNSRSQRAKLGMS